MDNKDNKDKREYIKELFDSDGIKAPESLSEEKMLAMLEAKDKVVSFDTAGSAEAPEISEADKAWKKARRRRNARRLMSVAAALLVAVIGVSGVYTFMTTAPDTSETGGELYTFKSSGEVKRTIRSMNSVSISDLFGNKSSDTYEYEDGIVYDSDVLSEGEAYDTYEAAPDSEASDSSAPKSLSVNGSETGSTSSGSSSSHSDTYLQVDDVDESDIVKTDGKYIYYVNSKQEVVILSANDGETEKVGTVGAGSVDNYVQDIYLKDDVLVTVGRFYTGDDEGSSGIVVYDISDRSSPVMISYFRQSGDIVTSRMVGSYVYLVTEDYVSPGGRYMPMSGCGDSYTKLSPSDISCLPEPKSCSYLVLSAIDITSGEQGKSRTRAVFGATDEIYFNDHYLYSVAIEWGNNSGDEYTRIVRASLDGLDIKFNGTAAVRGYTVNRFAMDESGGYFRIATTSRRNDTDVNNLYVLDSSLAQVGKVTGFARNESIKAVRYIGDKAYVITYEAIDPLFIIDLSDPEDPRIEGEVMIDGFSTLLVPAGEGRLLGIGHATGDNGYGGEYDSGLKLVLFDISDPSHPKVLDSREFENMTSPAQSDSHALTVNSEAGYYAIPYGVDNYEYDDIEPIIDYELPEELDDESQGDTGDTDAAETENGYEAGVLVFRADDTLSGIDQHALGSEYIARSVYIGDYIYALGRDGNCVSFRPAS